VIRVDPWRGVIEAFLDGETIEAVTTDEALNGKFDEMPEPERRDITCCAEILVKALGREPGRISTAEARRVKSLVLDIGGWLAPKRRKNFKDGIGKQDVLVRAGSPEDHSLDDL
jgi:hypothetical protein